MKLPIAKISQTPAFAGAAFQARRILAVYGRGGTGKTTVPRTLIGPALGFEEVQIVNLSGAGPQEASGYLIPDPVTRDGWFSAPECWPTAQRVGDKRVLLVLDEFPEWDPAVQSLARGLFNPNGAPMIGTHVLGSGVRIMLTGNLREHGSRSSVPSAPFVERCLSVLIEPDLDGWLDWAAAEGLAASPVFTFLRFQGGDQHGIDHFAPPIPQPWDGTPHPCPRSWEAACRATLPDAGLDAALTGLVLEGLVGPHAGPAAAAFVALVASMLPVLDAVRSGAAPMPADPADQQALVHCAVRIAKRDSARDPEAAVASGALDWLVERILLPVSGEIRAYGYRAAVASGVPLDQHPRRSALDGMAGTRTVA